jgi:hypothetical protein
VNKNTTQTYPVSAFGAATPSDIDGDWTCSFGKMMVLQIFPSYLPFLHREGLVFCTAKGLG